MPPLRTKYTSGSVSQALELFGFSNTKGICNRTASRAIDAVTRRSRLPSSTFAWSFSLKFGNPDRPGPPSRRGPGPEWVSRLAMDQDVQGKPIHMNKTRPRRMSRSSRLRFFNASRSASGPSMMSRLRNQSHVAQRRAQDGHSQRRAQQLSCLQRRQDDGRVAQRSGVEHRLEGPRHGCRLELYL